MKILKKNVLFMNTGAHSGAWNMEWDVQRAMALRAQSGLPSLRVYGWSPWCISLGRNQSTGDIDLDKAYADGIDVVHRPTGGRAILHADELTYSVVMPSGGKGTMETYRTIAEALSHGLQLLVPDISLSRSEPDFQKLYRQPGGIPCFSSSARYEIEHRGKKVVGSAQRRFASRTDGEVDVVLQHGSILIGDAHLALADYLALDEGSVEAIRSDMKQSTTTLRALAKRAVGFDEVAECVRQGFEEAWNIEFDVESVPRQLSTIRRAG